MSNFRNFDLLRTSELRLIRRGLFRPAYELTDGQFCYGQIKYSGNFLRSILLETAKESWTFKRSEKLNKTLFVYNSHDKNIASITAQGWKNKINLVMKTGFEAEFTKESFFSMHFFWTNVQLGHIIAIKESRWSYRVPYIITFNVGLFNKISEAPLLILLGVNFMILNRTRASVR